MEDRYSKRRREDAKVFRSMFLIIIVFAIIAFIAYTAITGGVDSIHMDFTLKEALNMFGIKM